METRTLQSFTGQAQLRDKLVGRIARDARRGRHTTPLIARRRGWRAGNGPPGRRTPPRVGQCDTIRHTRLAMGRLHARQQQTEEEQRANARAETVHHAHQYRSVVVLVLVVLVRRY